jgi:hypothetical protein
MMRFRLRTLLLVLAVQAVVVIALPLLSALRIVGFR